MQYLYELVYLWDLKFVDFSIKKVHEIKCPTNINDFTVNENFLPRVSQGEFLYEQRSRPVRRMA